MGSDFSTLGLSHDLDQLEKEILNKGLLASVANEHNWCHPNTSTNINISEDGRKALCISNNGKFCSVRGKKDYKYGVHFFKLTWDKSKASEEFTIGVGTDQVPLQMDGDFLLGSNDNSIGWNPYRKTIHYNNRLIKTYPDLNKKPFDYKVPNCVTLVINMDQCFISFRVGGEDFGYVMSGLNHVSHTFCVAATLKNKSESVEVCYLGGSEDTQRIDKPLRFHTKCGRNITFDANHTIARRHRPKRNYNGATVLTHRPLANGEEFRVKLHDIDGTGCWTGCLNIGVTTAHPDTTQYPPDSLIDFTTGRTWAYKENKLLYNGKEDFTLSSDLNDLQVGDVVSITKLECGLMIAVGRAVNKFNIENFPTELFGFVDVYAQTLAVEMVHSECPRDTSTSPVSLQSLDQFIDLLKSPNVTQVPVVCTILEKYSQKLSANFRSSLRELSDYNRPKIIAKYLQFLNQQIRTTSNQQFLKCLKLLLYFLTRYSSGSELLCTSLGNTEIIQDVIQILNNNKQGSMALTESLLHLLYNCSRFTENRQQFQKTNYVKIASTYMDRNRYNNQIVMFAYLTISYIYNKDQLHLLKLPNDVVVLIVEYLIKSSEAKTKQYKGWHSNDLVRAVTNFSQVDNNVLAFVKNDVMIGLMRVLNSSDVSERECAINAMCNLINSDTKDIVRKTDYFLERLELLKENDKCVIQQGVEKILTKMRKHGLSICDSSSLCKYQSLCKRFKLSLKLPDPYFSASYDTCYCSKCHVQRKAPAYKSRGLPPKNYGVPVGWCRFGLRTAPRAEALQVFKKWHRTFHGTRKESVEKILQVGELVPAGRSVLGGKLVAELPGHFSEEGFKPEGFDTKRIFLSPSIKYSGIDSYSVPTKFKDPLTGKSHRAKTAFSVLVNPESYQVGAETIGADEEIDPGFSNQEMEWIVEEQGSTILYGLLVKID